MVVALPVRDACADGMGDGLQGAYTIMTVAPLVAVSPPTAEGTIIAEIAGDHGARGG